MTTTEVILTYGGVEDENTAVAHIFLWKLDFKSGRVGITTKDIVIHKFMETSRVKRSATWTIHSKSTKLTRKERLTHDTL